MTRYPDDAEQNEENKTIFYSIITDTHHTSRYAVRLAHRANKKGTT